VFHQFTLLWTTPIYAVRYLLSRDSRPIYPQPVSKGELAERASAYLGKPMSATSGGYFNNLGTLRSLKLIDYPSPGTVVALPVLFLEGAA